MYDISGTLPLPKDRSPEELLRDIVHELKVSMASVHTDGPWTIRFQSPFWVSSIHVLASTSYGVVTIKTENHVSVLQYDISLRRVWVVMGLMVTTMLGLLLAGNMPVYVLPLGLLMCLQMYVVCWIFNRVFLRLYFQKILNPKGG